MQQIRIIVHLRETDAEEPRWRKAHQVIIDEDYSPQMIADTIGALDDRVQSALGRA